MKYIVDIDAFADCLECLQGMTINDKVFVSTEMIKAFIERFPKDPVIAQTEPHIAPEPAE